MRRGDAQIVARQKREQFMEKFTASRDADDRQRIVANWEMRGDNRVAQKDLHRRLDEVQAEHRDSLVERRRRLAALLLGEKEECDRLLVSLAETVEQRRERIVRKARDLRAQREVVKRADTAARSDRLFREKVDCLRQAESRLKVMQVADARFDQLGAAQRRKAEEDEEAAFFAQQSAEASRLATERAQRDLEGRYARDQRMAADLAAQVDGNVARAAIAADEQRREDADFARRLHEDTVVEEHKRLSRRAAQRELAEEMRLLNEELERARKDEYARLKREDRELLDEIMAEIAEDQRREREGKEAKIETRRQEWHDLQARAAQKKDDSSAMDKLWAEANEAEWAKREKQWKATADKRAALLRSILIVRRQQVLDKRQQERDDAGAKAREHAEFLETLAHDDGREAAVKARRAADMTETQMYLDWQIAQRRTAKELELAERRSELTAQGAMEKEYEDRIRQEMANLEAARPERYSDVQLLTARQRNQLF